MKHTFLVEIGTEELPPKMLRILGESFADNLCDELDTANIDHGQVSWFGTPRRLAVKVVSLNNTQVNIYIEKRGPTLDQAFDKNGNPTKAAKCWARRFGILVSQAEHLATEKGQWLVYRTKITGKPIQELLCDMVSRSLNKLPIPKMMRWGDDNNKFIRPLHTVTMLLDNNIIIGNILGINVNRIIYGHRFIGEQEIYLEHADHYPQILIDRGRVIADYVQRKNIIRRDAESAAKRLGGIVDLSDSLLEEVTSLVEWPVVLTANFEEKFLSVPIEALVHTMKNDQKYFPVYDFTGKLLPYFIFVANIESKNYEQIIAGNERVIRPRLANAEFFFNIDRQHRLEDRLPQLDSVLFHKHLGTLRDKSNRIEALSAWIASQVGADIFQSARAGLLSKCDLMTNMVSEFNDIKGIMGMYYARYDGEPEDVALAQKEHYYPRFSGDKLPSNTVACTVSIADKIDTITGMFGINQHPKRNKDPFALRRAALGMLRIIVNKQLPIDLRKLVEKSVCLYGKRLTNHAVINNVIDFIFGRFYAWYLEQGYDSDTIHAVLALRPTCPIDFDARVQAVSYFRTLKAAASLTAAYKRISNILTKSKDFICYEKNLQISMFKNQAEITLMMHLVMLREKLKPLFKANRYQDILVELTTLSKPVDAFFDNVMIMTDDYHLRINRLMLIAQVRELFLQVADISAISVK